jgi:hypothetical protein
MINKEQVQQIQGLRLQLGMNIYEFNKIIQEIYGISLIQLSKKDANDVIRSMQTYITHRNQLRSIGIKKTGFLQAFLGTFKRALKEV